MPDSKQQLCASHPQQTIRSLRRCTNCCLGVQESLDHLQTNWEWKTQFPCFGSTASLKAWEMQKVWLSNKTLGTIDFVTRNSRERHEMLLRTKLNVTSDPANGMDCHAASRVIRQIINRILYVLVNNRFDPNLLTAAQLIARSSVLGSL